MGLLGLRKSWYLVTMSASRKSACVKLPTDILPLQASTLQPTYSICSKRGSLILFFRWQCGAVRRSSKMKRCAPPSMQIANHGRIAQIFYQRAWAAAVVLRAQRYFTRYMRAFLRLTGGRIAAQKISWLLHPCFPLCRPRLKRNLRAVRFGYNWDNVSQLF